MPTFDTGPRKAVAELRISRIREVANAAMGREGVLPFWFGEPDEVTPEFIRAEAVAALAAGDTFYRHNLGIPELRDALAGYVSGLRSPTSERRIAVTSSGMSALALTMQSLVDPGDRVVALTPSWPNLVEGPKILGGRVTTVALDFDHRGWRLDIDRMLDAITADTRMVIVNSPNNPTGWALSREARDAILGRCRQQGTWLVSDDAYERLYYADEHGCAPGFLDVADPGDRLVSVNTFSKSWLMTGWRLGWIVAPEALVEGLSKLIEYNTSCAPGFVQRAGVVAVREGEPLVRRTRERFRAARDFLVERLATIPGIEVAAPEAAMYAFFRTRQRDSLTLCKDLVTEAGLGLAPGIAFGAEGEGFLRWCFAASHDRLAEGAARLERHLARATAAVR